MPYYKTSQEWLEQSRLLLEARPSTTRITTKYSIKPVTTNPKKSSSADDTTAATPAPRGSLVIKTYDPASGVCLKYRTTKAAEVSRLIYASLGKLSRGMAAVPEPPEEAMPDAPLAGASKAEGGNGNGSGNAGDKGAAGTGAGQGQQQAQQQGGGGGKKKKKGKK